MPNSSLWGGRSRSPSRSAVRTLYRLASPSSRKTSVQVAHSTASHGVVWRRGGTLLRALLLLTAFGGVLLGMSACAEEGGADSPYANGSSLGQNGPNPWVRRPLPTAPPPTYWRTIALPMQSLQVNRPTPTELQLNLPSNVDALGLVLQSSARDVWVEVAHSGTTSILQPDGNPVRSIPRGVLRGLQALTLFLSADGSPLPSGAYRLPISAARNAETSFALQAYPYLRQRTVQPPTLRLRLIVLENTVYNTRIDCCVNDPTRLQSHAGMLRTIEVLQDIWERDADLRIRLDLRLELLAGSAARTLIRSPQALGHLLADASTPPDDALHVFIVESLPALARHRRRGGLHTPGPYGHTGTMQSGAAVEYTPIPEVLGQRIAHEMGHYLGLRHTTEFRGARPMGRDSLADTPDCLATRRNPGRGLRCPDQANLMFPFPRPSAFPEVSAQQGTRIRMNPLVNP